MNLRFKTKEEFEKEFGEDWRNIVHLQWVSDPSVDGGMDYLFGQPYDGTGHVTNPKNGKLWSISRCMVTSKPLPAAICSIADEQQIILNQEI